MPRILVVDDDVTSRAMFSRALAKYGDVDTAVATLTMENGVLAALTVARHNAVNHVLERFERLDENGVLGLMDLYGPHEHVHG